jgi:hypothetical protein
MSQLQKNHCFGKQMYDKGKQSYSAIKKKPKVAFM